ncbi:MAG TPA: LysR family transcriptional regulator [Ramlibacter sp.]|jgi:DNA-binding transcriptional LysR family regulator|nr:LysR family transcriptional regulator [Ramlibacter sp.]
MNQGSRVQRLDLQTLRLFASVAKDGSISRAAERQHIAASALSRRLADLEHAVGADLFVRSPKGVQVTDVGRAVLKRAERIQDELRGLLDDVAAVQEEQTTVKLYASHSVVGGVLPELLRAFRPGPAKVRVEICEASSMEVATACADGVADLGIGLEVHGEIAASLDAWTLLPDTLQVLMREEHPLARSQQGVRFEQVLAFPTIGSNPAGALSELLRQRAALLGLPYVAEVTASNFSAACRLAEAGLGIAIMPGTAVPSGLAAPLVQRPLLEAWAERPLRVYAGRRSASTAAVRALLEHLRRQSRVVAMLRDQGEPRQPAARIEAQFAVAALLPFEQGAPVALARRDFVGTAELHKP